MKEILDYLKKIGIPSDEIARIEAHYKDDIDGLYRYAMFVRAMYDDRHEYVV